MKRIARALIRLYPANWRERYGEEFEALLEDNPATAFTVFDLLKGAVKMQLKIPAFSKLAVILSIGGMLAGLGVSFIIPSRYVSTAEMRYAPGSSRDPAHDLVEFLTRNENSVLSRTSLSTIIKDPRLDLYARERTHMPLEDVIEKMRSDITIVADPIGGVARESLTFHVQFTYRDRVKARDTVQALITKFQDANLIVQRTGADASPYDDLDRLEERITVIEKRLGIPTPQPTAARMSFIRRAGVMLDVLDPPSLPTKPASPNRSFFMLAGFGAGFALALIVAIFRRKMPPIPFPAQTA